nr:hypothetical protein [Dehalococcoides mccartyi]
MDVKQSCSVIAVKVKPPFKPIFQVAVSKKESKIRILNEPVGTSPAGSSVFLAETGESWLRFEQGDLAYSLIICLGYIK